MKMAQCKKERCRNMSIFQDFLTRRWAILAKSCKDVPMALLSQRKPLGMAASRPFVSFTAIAAPLGRLERAVYEFTA